MADFSIITVAYNSEKTIRRTIESVLNQTMAPIEYIIVDGLSKDKTVEIANSYKEIAREKGIELIVISEHDNGMYDAMNKGIKMAKGQIVGMINSDDYYETDAIAKVNKVYETKGFDMFFADLIMHMPNGSTFIKKARNRKYSTSRDWNHPTTFITKSLYKTYQYKNETIHDDYDLVLRIKKSGAKIEILNEPLANFTMEGVSHQRNLKDTIQRIKIKYQIYRNNGYSPFYIVECVMVEVAKFIIG